MALTPLDIHHKEFGSARFGGYKEEEVDSFLDLVADEYERMIQENSDTRQQIEQMKKRLQDFEEMQTSLQSALLAATKSAEVIKEQARQESEAMVAKAQEDSDSLVRSAQEQGRQMILRAQSESQKLERENAKLKEIKKRYLQAIKDLAQSHIEQVGEISRSEQESAGEAALFQPEAQPVAERPAAAEPSVVKKESPPAHLEPPVQDPTPPVAKEAWAAVTAPPVVEESERRIGFVAPGPTEARQATAVEPAVVARTEVADVEKPVPAPGAVSMISADTQAGGREAPRGSSNLVDEILAMEGDEDVFTEFAKEEDIDERERQGRKPRKEKRGDRHFFWE